MNFPSTHKLNYRISSYSFHGNYSFLNLEIQRSQYKGQRLQYINVRKLFKGGSIQGRKLYEEIRYEVLYIFRIIFRIGDSTKVAISLSNVKKSMFQFLNQNMTCF